MNQKKVGSRLKGLLVTYDIKQNDLAKERNLSESSISDKLNGNSNITVEELIAFLNFINKNIPKNEQKDPNYLFGWNQ